jgi:hypothetical protein
MTPVAPAPDSGAGVHQKSSGAAGRVDKSSQSVRKDDEVQDEQQYISEPDVIAYDDGNVVATGTEAVAEMDRWIDRMQEHNQRVLAQVQPSVRPTTPVRPARGRSPRKATNTRRKGSRRSRASSSSDDDPPPKPCALEGCGLPRAHGERHCSAEHRRQDARERQQRQRARNRQDPEAARERIADYAVAHNRPLEPSFCHCGSEAAYPFDHRWWCVPCGLPIEGEYSSVNGHLASRDVLDILDEQARLGVRHGESEPLELRREPNAGPWPDRTYFDPTIVKDPIAKGVRLGA